jgi:hypothetical protein
MYHILHGTPIALKEQCNKKYMTCDLQGVIDVLPPQKDHSWPCGQHMARFARILKTRGGAAENRNDISSY